MDAINRDFAPSQMTEEEISEMFGDGPPEAENSFEQNEADYWNCEAGYGHEYEFVAPTG